MSGSKSLTLVVDMIYESASPFKEGLAWVTLDGKTGAIDKTGKLVIPMQNWDVKDFSEGLAGVCLNDKWGYVDKKGNMVIPALYDYITEFHDGAARVSLYLEDGDSSSITLHQPLVQYWNLRERPVIFPSSVIQEYSPRHQ